MRAGLFAGALGLILVMLYVAVYYRSLGLQTWIGLGTFSALTYSLVVLLGKSIGWNPTLAGIAGLIVSIGITTDSYIVFFERVKEEVHAGKTLRSSIDRGYKSALHTLLIADAVTFFAAVILFLLAVGSVKGFALTLGMATALDVALFLALTYPLAALLARSKTFSQGRFLGMKGALEGTGKTGLLRKIFRSEFAIDFIGKRKRWLAISAVLVAISVAALIPGIRGLKYGIDFRGGSIFKVPISKTVTVTGLKDALTNAGVPSPEVQIFTDNLPPHAKSATIQTQSITNPDVQAKVVDALAKATGTPANQVSVDVVGSTWGSQITTKAIEGLIVFLIVVIIYMALRLEPKMSAAGIIALIHDLAITAGIYAIVGFQVTPATVVATLTILGYSLYDTVVVFDKIKENVIPPSNAQAVPADRQRRDESDPHAVYQHVALDVDTGREPALRRQLPPRSRHPAQTPPGPSWASPPVPTRLSSWPRRCCRSSRRRNPATPHLPPPRRSCDRRRQGRRQAGTQACSRQAEARCQGGAQARPARRRTGRREGQHHAGGGRRGPRRPG